MLSKSAALNSSIKDSLRLLQLFRPQSLGFYPEDAQLLQFNTSSFPNTSGASASALHRAPYTSACCHLKAIYKELYDSTAHMGGTSQGKKPLKLKTVEIYMYHFLAR